MITTKNKKKPPPIMNHNSFQLSILNPCQEEWKQMIPQENGRHCAHCSKLVIDFTQMSDKEISDLFKNSHERICGKLTKKQTQKIYYSYSEEKRTRFHLPRIAASWLLVSWLSLSPTVNAQKLKPEITEQVAKNTANNQTQTPRILKGTVIDAENKEPLISVEIYIDSNIHSSSDFDGNFILNIPDNIPNQTEIVFRYLGYESQKISINSIDFSKPLNIQLKEEIHLLGEVIIKSKGFRRKNKYK